MKNKYYNFNLENGVIPKYQVIVQKRGYGKNHFLNQLEERKKKKEKDEKH